MDPVVEVLREAAVAVGVEVHREVEAYQAKPQFRLCQRGTGTGEGGLALFLRRREVIAVNVDTGQVLLVHQYRQVALRLTPVKVTRVEDIAGGGLVALPTRVVEAAYHLDLRIRLTERKNEVK